MKKEKHYNTEKTMKINKTLVRHGYEHTLVYVGNDRAVIPQPCYLGYIGFACKAVKKINT